MARPCKSIEGQVRHNTKEEIEERRATEETLRGLADKIEKPPDYLTEPQKEIYNFIIEELRASKILSNLDVYILSTTCIAIDRLKTIEEIINKKTALMTNKELMSSKDKYTKDFFRGCNELSLSPQSRAKFGSLAFKDKENKEDPLIKALAEANEDDDE